MRRGELNDENVVWLAGDVAGFVWDRRRCRLWRIKRDGNLEPIYERVSEIVHSASAVSESSAYIMSDCAVRWDYPKAYKLSFKEWLVLAGKLAMMLVVLLLVMM